MEKDRVFTYDMRGSNGSESRGNLSNPVEGVLDLLRPPSLPSFRLRNE